MSEAAKLFLSLICAFSGSVLLYVLVVDMTGSPSIWTQYDIACAIAGTLLFAGGITAHWHRRKTR
jgi:hypothetical protein